MYRKKERGIHTKTFTHLLSLAHYTRRGEQTDSVAGFFFTDPPSRFGPFFIEPVVAGLTPPTEPSLIPSRSSRPWTR